MRLFLLSTLVFLVISAKGQVNNDPYRPGEMLKYLLYYGWLDGGEAVMTLSEENYNDQKVYYTKVVAKSVGLADILYKVYDVYESYFDPVTVLPYKAIRNIKEGGYRYYNEVLFLHDEDSVDSQRSGKQAIPKNCFDMLSALYELRRKIHSNMVDGDTIRIETYFGDEVFPMVLRYRGKEAIKTKIGIIECLKFVPVVEVGRVFKEEDDMIMWFADKPNYVPIRVKFELFVGSLKCDLIEYENLKYGL